jgi:hypothetical protein
VKVLHIVYFVQICIAIEGAVSVYVTKAETGVAKLKSKPGADLKIGWLLHLQQLRQFFMVILSQ